MTIDDVHKEILFNENERSKKNIFLSFYKGDITKTLSAIEEMMADPAN